MSQYEVALVEETMTSALTAVDEVAALLDPTSTGRTLPDLEPEDWCAFGEA
ncbi:MAG: hypothetical protein IPI32_13050 [Austwickia sp.]|jgi:hypothetical protein|nr:hypothetical protein [Austwickia sp.]MBK8435159.1 hypothetical protein [Austwickia sp.]MBK9101287.1 hypothetical protein [Austwickia sp.]